MTALRRGSAVKAAFGTRPVIALAAALLPVVNACKNDGSSVTNPTSASKDPGTAISSTISPPTSLEPESGRDLVATQPVLTVRNATTTDGSELSYSFEVARDVAFTDIAARSPSVPEGGGGRTSWAVSPRLGDGRYFWRARAQNARGATGAFSAVFEYRLSQSDVLIFDSLQNGSSVGRVSGGRFLSQGWQVTSKNDFIRYEVPTLTAAFVEWENTGLRPDHQSPEQQMLFGMWDPTAGPYRDNAFRAHVQKLDQADVPPLLRLRFIANGEEHNTGADAILWQPGQVYRWRIEWGSQAFAGNAAALSLNGLVLMVQPYTRTYAPRTHWIELGIQERQQSIVGVTYANVRIGTKS